MLLSRQSAPKLVQFVLFYCVVVIIALVGAIGLFNALAMSVLERRREIGILRSMGATGGKVAQVFWTESVSLGVVAWGVALIVGIPAAYGFVRLLGQLLFQVPFAFDPTSLIVMLVFLLVVATVAAGAGLGRVAGEVRPDLALGVTLPTLGERMQTPEVVTSLASAPVMKRLSDGSKTDHRSAGCGAGALAGAGSVVY